MSTETPAATEATKTSLENSITWFLSDKLQDASTTIATKKYLTVNNKLIYLTRLNAAEMSVPTFKVQVFERVDHGVHESGYQMFADHRFVKYENAMIFGTQSGTASGNVSTTVSEEDAHALLDLVNGLGTARQTL
jgi:hypothetical protein